MHAGQQAASADEVEGAQVSETVDIPIAAAAAIAELYGYDQVVVIARKVGTGASGREHVTTYGVDKVHCGVAARIGEFIKFKLMGWKP